MKKEKIDQWLAAEHQHQKNLDAAGLNYDAKPICKCCGKVLKWEADKKTLKPTLTWEQTHEKFMVRHTHPIVYQKCDCGKGGNYHAR